MVFICKTILVFFNRNELLSTEFLFLLLMSVLIEYGADFFGVRNNPVKFGIHLAD